jgi:hypothetical protein
LDREERLHFLPDTDSKWICHNTSILKQSDN